MLGVPTPSSIQTRDPCLGLLRGRLQACHTCLALCTLVGVSLVSIGGAVHCGELALCCVSFGKGGTAACLSLLPLPGGSLRQNCYLHSCRGAVPPLYSFGAYASHIKGQQERHIEAEGQVHRYRHTRIRRYVCMCASFQRELTYSLCLLDLRGRLVMTPLDRTHSVPCNGWGGKRWCRFRELVNLPAQEHDHTTDAGGMGGSPSLRCMFATRSHPPSRKGLPLGDPSPLLRVGVVIR